ncbi:MAG: ribonuclease H family protein [Ignavibacteria bacterium]|nr:ribonuclease H family protein [Ignavibacteria bacterium]
MPITRAPKKSKWYVVWIGHSPGLYPSWDKCRDQVEGYPGSRYRAYDTLAEAKEAFEKGLPKQIVKHAPADHVSLGKTKSGARGPIVPSISVDAACNMTTGVMEYRGVDTQTGVELFRMGPFSASSNNLGEFLAVVHALGMQKKNSGNLPVYTDSKTALAWVRKKHAKTTVAPSDKNSELFALINRAEEWLRTNAYDNRVLKWDTDKWGENPADFGRKR